MPAHRHGPAADISNGAETDYAGALSSKEALIRSALP
jgi:hypothetical protein